MPKSQDVPDIRIFAVDNAMPLGKASGVYTWVIGTDTVYSDSLAAQSFGFGETEAREGLPLISYLSRMHPDDRPRVAKAIHDTMLTGNPYCEQYRVCRPDGSIVEVVAFGSCFRDVSGEPSHYSGVLFPATKIGTRSGSLIGHLLAAHDAARRDGKPALASKIAEALAEASNEEEESTSMRPVGRLH